MTGTFECLHQRACVLAESLLAGHEFVAVVAIFHLPLLRVAGEADVVVRGEQQAGPFALEPLADRVDLARLRFLLGDEVVQAEHHQRVRVGQHPFVNRQPVTGLVDALEHGDGVPGRLADDLLEGKRGPVEQLQGPADALQEVHLVPLGGFESRPRDPANLGHRGKPIVQLGEIAVRFPRIAPGPVNAHAAFAGRVLTGDVVLVVCAGGLR